MNDLLQELPSLIISVLLIIMITLLLALRVLPASDPLVQSIATPLLSLWLLSRAFKWQAAPPSPTRTVVSGAYNPVPQRASRPVQPPQGGSVAADPTQPGDAAQGQ